MIRLRLDGKSKYVKARTKTDCIRKAEILKAEHRNRVNQSYAGFDIQLTVAIDHYLKDRENVLSPSTLVGYRDIQRNRFKAFMDKPLGTINWQQAVNLEAKVASPKTVKNAFGLMKSVCRENGVTIPPLKLPGAVKKEKQWLTPEQIRVFMHAMEGKQHEIAALLALHSLRKSEVCGLRWSDIDLEHGLIHVNGAMLINPEGEYKRREQNKTFDSNRVVPIFIPRLRTLLAESESKEGLIIKAHPETPYRQFQKVCQENGLPLVGWHGLRHSFASLCYSQEINEMTCMRLGGWSDFKTMRTIYTHLSESDAMKGVNKLAEFFEKQ